MRQGGTGICDLTVAAARLAEEQRQRDVESSALARAELAEQIAWRRRMEAGYELADRADRLDRIAGIVEAELRAATKLRPHEIAALSARIAEAVDEG